jgi:hypothetical protein
MRRSHILTSKDFSTHEPNIQDTKARKETGFNSTPSRSRGPRDRGAVWESLELLRITVLVTAAPFRFGGLLFVSSW